MSRVNRTAAVSESCAARTGKDGHDGVFVGAEPHLRETPHLQGGGPMSEDWKHRGRCAEVDPELWFPEKGDSVRPAKRICRTCEVRVQCLEYALSNPSIQHGVWGGVSGRELIEMRRAA